MEVFGGGGSVLLNKERSVREILNDANGNLINLYRVVREHPDELKDRLLYVLHSREDFQIAQHRLALDAYKDDIQRAADFFQVVKQSYAGNGKPIDAVEIYYYTPDGVTPLKKAKYRVAPTGKDYYSLQYDNEKTNGQDGYAGLFGKEIGKWQVVIE